MKRTTICSGKLNALVNVNYLAQRLVEAAFRHEDPKEFLKHMPDGGLPRPEDVTYNLEREPEHERPEAVFIDDPEAARDIRDQIKMGNRWAWFTAHATAAWTAKDGTTYVGHDYLGCCSYRNREDFMAPGGYWDDLMGDAYADLIKKIKRAKKDR